MLQGLRRKIGRYAPVGGVEEALEEGGGKKERLREDATPLEAAVWHFNRQDRALRRLETAMRQMLDQIRATSVSMATVAETFSETWSDKEYIAAMKQIEREDVDHMEQSIRFNILDPLQARLEKYDQLKKGIHDWRKLTAESKMLRVVALETISSRLVDDEKRPHIEVDLYSVAALLQEAEAALLPQLEDAVQSEDVSAAALFKTTRLQTAIFLQNANQSIQSSLSPSEREVVMAANPQAFKYSTAMGYNSSSVSLSSKLSNRSSLASDGWSEVDGSSSSTALDGVETISGSDDDDESNVLPITIEDFETGRVLQANTSTKGGAEQQLANKPIDTSEIGTLAAYPVAKHYGDDDKGGKDADGEQSNMTSSWSQTASLKPITSRRTTSMLSSIRKTFWGTLSYASGEARMIRQNSAPITATSAIVVQGAVDSPRKCSRQLHIIPQSPKQWLAIEDWLWELDVRAARSPGKPLLQTDLISFDADDILSRLLQKDDSLCFECLSYLHVDDLARLSKVNFRLHSGLADNAPIWKKCIRSGGLSPTIRSSLWLSVFYESTPWRSCTIASHYLSADRRRSMYEQLLTKVGTTVADECIADGPPVIIDDTQLAIWFREIDVDVVRTCHPSVCAKVVPRTFPTIPTAAVDNFKEDSVEPVVREMVNTIARTEEEDTFFGSSSYRSPSTSSLSANASTFDLEGKMRRVLRAYVVYNPRVGYCQGMGFLVRLLAEIAVDEADIFWLFVGFSEPETDHNLYEPGMAVLQPYLSKFERLLSTHMPQLYAHFQDEGVHVAAFCTRWFLTFFSSLETLAPSLVTRLLDLFILDGWRVMFSFSLVILSELQPQLMTCDMEGILRILQFPRSYMPASDEHHERQVVRHALAFSVTLTLDRNCPPNAKLRVCP